MAATFPWTKLLEDYFPEIRGRQPNDEGFISIRCPLHHDTKKSAALNLESGRFLCHNPTCRDAYLAHINRPEGAKSLAYYQLLAAMQGWSDPEAKSVIDAFRVEHLDDDFKPDDDTSRNTTLQFFSKEIEEFVEQAAERLRDQFEGCEVALDYSESRGISRDTLVAHGVGFVPGREYLPDGSSTGVTGCLLMPYWFKDKLVGVRVRQADSCKRMVKHSHYVPYAINSVYDTTSRTIVIGEGESDTLRLRQMLRDRGYGNVPVIGTPGAHFDITWSRFLARFNRIIGVPQADRPSQKEFCGDLRAAFEGRLEIVQIPWEDDALGGKDVCDFLEQPGDNEDILTRLLSVTGHDEEIRPYLKTWSYFDDRRDREIDWFVPQVIERGSKVLLVGDPKVGKTFMLLNIIESAIHQTPFMGREEWTPTTGGLRCLLVEEEGSENALGKRITNIIGPTDHLGVIHGEHVKLDDPVSFARLRQAVTHFRPDLLLLDPYASLHNQVENDVDGTMVVMDAINILYRTVPGMTVVVVHHRDKAGKGPRGSGALWGAMDSQILAYQQDARSHIIGVEIVGREVELSEPMYFEFMPDTMAFQPVIASTVRVVSHKKLDTVLAAKVEDVLKDTDGVVTQKQIMDRIDGSEYTAVSLVLQQFTDSALVSRAGGPGRGGYTYVWTGKDL
jgi:hypothetical protein